MKFKELVKAKKIDQMEKNHCEVSDGKDRVNLDCDEVLRQIGGTRKWQLLNFLLYIDSFDCF